MNINSISTRIARYLAREMHYDARKEAQLVFGLELYFAAIIKTGCILILAFLLGIFRETLVIIIISGSLRLVSGGEHCTAFHRCLIGGALVFLFLGFVSQQLSYLISVPALVVLSMVSLIVVFLVLLKYAPGDTANKPITDEKEKKRYRRLSLLVAAVYFSIILVFLYSGIFPVMVLLILVGLLWQAFMITPWGYKFIRGVDKLLLFCFKGGTDHGSEDINSR